MHGFFSRTSDRGRCTNEATTRVYGTTSLLMASKGGHRQIVSLLLEYNADTEVAGRANATVDGSEDEPEPVQPVPIQARTSAIAA